MLPGEQEKRLKELELSIDRLRSLYDQYFRGIERMPPTVLQKKVERELREMRKEHTRNTSTRFKLQMQVQKYTTYLSYWQRVLRDLESGHMKRGAGVLIIAPPPVTAAAADEGAEEPVTGKFKPRRAPVRGTAAAAQAVAPAAQDEDLLDLDIDIEMDLDPGS